MRSDGDAMIHGLVSLHAAVHIISPSKTLSILIEMQFSRENCQPSKHQM